VDVIRGFAAMVSKASPGPPGRVRPTHSHAAVRSHSPSCAERSVPVPFMGGGDRTR
jgi:hypothetical protein